MICSASMADAPPLQDLYLERLPALMDSARAPTLVLLHGWGASSRVWRPWLGWLRRDCNVVLVDLPGFGCSGYRPLATAIEWLAAQLPEGAVLVGWSLGGQIATALATAFPRRWRGLVTIASNPRFVGAGDWPGMVPATFAAFRAQLGSNPSATLKQFVGLQASGCEFQRRTQRQLRALQDTADSQALRDGLDMLEQGDWRAPLEDCQLPALHLLGERDVLVPAAVAGQLPAAQQCVVLPGAAHAPFVSHPEASWQALAAFLKARGWLSARPSPRRDKRSVAASFSRAAPTYDGAASLQRAVCTRLLSACTPAGQRVLDLGCGTGAGSRRLAALGAEVLGLDLAEGMLRHARAQIPSTQYWLCGDAENLPLAGASVDGVFSSLSAQWCEDPDALFSELARVLRPGGWCAIATLGPATLEELRQTWASVDGHARVNEFPSRSALQTAWQAAGLHCSEWREERRVLHYPDVFALSRELKDLGAHNLNQGRPAGLQGRRRFQAWQAAYEALREVNGLPASYQVWYLQLNKPDEQAG